MHTSNPNPPLYPLDHIIRYRRYKETLQVQRTKRKEQLSAKNYNKDMPKPTKTNPKKRCKSTSSTKTTKIRKEIADLEKHGFFSSQFLNISITKGVEGYK